MSASTKTNAQITLEHRNRARRLLTAAEERRRKVNRVASISPASVTDLARFQVERAYRDAVAIAEEWGVAG